MSHLRWSSILPQIRELICKHARTPMEIACHMITWWLPMNRLVLSTCGVNKSTLYLIVIADVPLMLL